MFMFSIPKNKTSKAISQQLITPLKRLAFSLLIAFSLFSYSANATEIKPIAFSTGIDIIEGTAGTIVRLTHPDPATPFNSTNTSNVQLAGGIAISEVTFDPRIIRERNVEGGHASGLACGTDQSLGGLFAGFKDETHE